jgi:NAD(P)-dependent dehydrogenase (short-subunit alcohol dehydrogenase family)
MPLAVVTGANRGLGLETSRVLTERGDRVLLAVRREQEGKRAAAGLSGGGREAFSWPLDVGDPASVDAFAERARREKLRIDALVNNAGVYLSGTDAAAFRESIAVNVLGPLRLTDGLALLLAPGARVVMVSSGLGELSGLPAELRQRVEGLDDREGIRALAAELVARATSGRGGGAYLAYSTSKAMLGAVTRILAAELSPRGILVNAVDPGWVRTEMGGANAPRSVEDGAAGIVWAATLGRDGPSGRLFHDGRPIPW